MNDPTIHQVWLEDPAETFTRLVKAGGWPMDKEYASVYHGVKTEDRHVKFSNAYLRNEWYSTFAHRDDYLWWMMSKRGKDSVIKKVIKKHTNHVVSSVRNLELPTIDIKMVSE